jgi:ribosome biogenesis GTPase / thiamine phosphate phosphatase
MTGVVVKSTGSWYDVQGTDGKKYACRVRGKIRLEGIKENNPIAVGDRIEFELEDNLITSILPRENHILRQSVKKTGHAHVLAANVQQFMLMVTLSYPRTSPGFVDRSLVAAESFRIPQVLIFNKEDLLDQDEQNRLRDTMVVYDSIGVGCLSLSALHSDISVVFELLKNKVTLLAGHSGVGKSTLLNRLSPDIHQKVGRVSEFSEKGIHTTTYAEMFQLDPQTFVIDTPGIKEWGLVDMTPEEISDYFPEMRERRLDCRFGPRCIHLQEPKCAIIEAVRRGDIALSRYESYVSMVLGEDNRK